MTPQDRAHLKKLEGHHVSVALADGSRIDDCELVAVSRGRRGHLWVHSNGGDAFVPMSQVSDVSRQYAAGSKQAAAAALELNTLATDLKTAIARFTTE